MSLSTETIDAINKADFSRQDVFDKRADQSTKEDAAREAATAASDAAAATREATNQHAQNKAAAVALVERDLSV